MNCPKFLQQVIGVILVIVLLVGCGAPSATPPPPRTQPGDAPTVISEPPSPMQPGQPSSSPSPTQPGRPLQLPSPPQPAGLPRALTVALDAAVTGAPISPYIYGMFIEHQGRCIYGGIWAEMVEDRKFFYPRIASALHGMFRNSDLVFMANTHPVNVHGHVKTTQTAAAFEVTALPLIVYRHHFGTLPLTINGDTRPLDVAAARTTDHQSLTVAVVNPTPQSYALTLDLKNAQITGTGRWWRIASTDPLAYNEPGQPPRVAIEEGPLSSTSPVLDVPPLSIILYKLPAQPGQTTAQPGQPTGQSGLFRFIRTVAVTPDSNFKTGSFARINYVPATGRFVVTFGTKASLQSGDFNHCQRQTGM